MRFLKIVSRGYCVARSVDCVKMVRILNVAEKNDAAKSIADIMSRGGYRKREGFSKFNKIYEFDYNILNQNSSMTMTSVSGHLLNFAFTGTYRKWYGCSPVALFDAPVQKNCPQDYTDIKRTLEREIRGSQALIIWTDCDREGENIGFEVIQVCRQVKPNIRVYRAKFSEITHQAVQRAVNNLLEPDQNTSDAVDVRQELDLRIGAAFTRFQTLRLQKVFPTVLADQLISYGSCQFPTLGFVVERYKQVQAFVPEPFWKIKVSHETEDGHVDFSWKRGKLFDHEACVVLYEHVIESPLARVTDVKSKPKSKWRPVALDTVELEKLASRKMRINAKETMKIAEKLYTQGLISYPRTETNIFPKDLNLSNLVQQQTQDQEWGGFAAGILARGGPTPRNGNKSDQAHPPIHPIKYTNGLQGNEKRVYEFVVRHFLACCSQDAQGQETTVEIDINEEKFSASGLMILARNYLDVYPYDRWSDKAMPTFHSGEEFEPDSIELNQGETSAPSLLTEADLIALMDKHGIGTDATHADHIETIKSRLYVGVQQDGKFVPGELGMGLVEGYDAMGYEMSKPHLRAELESDLKLICEGRKDKDVVLATQIENYKNVFIAACEQAVKIDTALAAYFGNAQPYDIQAQEHRLPDPIKPCPKCGQSMVLKTKKDNKGFFISCTGYPDCREVMWLPDGVLEAVGTNTPCPNCQPNQINKVKFKFKRGSVPQYIPTEYEGCVVCDDELKDALNIRSSSQRQGTQVTPSVSGNSHNRSSASNQSLNSSGRSQSRRSDSGYLSGTSQLTPSLPSQPHSAITKHPPTSRPRNPLTEVNPRGPTQPPYQGGGDRDEDANDVMCNCGQGAVKRTVRKDGPNQGRLFYVCAKQQDVDDRCSFFLWADSGEASGGGAAGDSNAGRASQYNRSSNVGNYGNPAASSSSSDGGVQCNCNQAAKQLKVQKEGPNKGRPFFACPKPMGQGCKFFQWADEAPPMGSGNRGYHTSSVQSSGQSGMLGNSYRGGAVNNRGGANMGTSNQGARKSRKCGVCRQEGHTKKNCPMNR